jgi:ribose transport system substrate-binding protein
LAGVIENTSDPYWQTVICGAEAEAKTEDASLKMYTQAQLGDSQYQTSFSSALLTDPKGIFVNPFTPGLLSSQVATLMKKGVPVTTGDTPMDPATDYRLVTFSSDISPFFSAMSAAMGSSGSVLILQGSTNPVAVARIQPVINYIKKYKPGITILPITYDNFDVNKAATITAAALVAHPNLKLIYAPSGPQGQGAVSAVEAAHKTGKVKIWAFGGEPEEVNALKSGAISALIGQGAYLVGQDEVKSLVSYIKAHPHGGAVTQTSTIQIPLVLITKSNVNSAAMQPYIFKSTCSGDT